MIISSLTDKWRGAGSRDINGGVKMGFVNNLSKLIDGYGVVGAMEVINVMLTQEIETIEELNDCIKDELTYMAESN